MSDEKAGDDGCDGNDLQGPAGASFCQRRHRGRNREPHQYGRKEAEIRHVRDEQPCKRTRGDPPGGGASQQRSVYVELRESPKLSALPASHTHRRLDHASHTDRSVALSTVHHGFATRVINTRLRDRSIDRVVRDHERGAGWILASMRSRSQSRYRRGNMSYGVHSPC
jgi:hypothetical protein